MIYIEKRKKKIKPYFVVTFNYMLDDSFPINIPLTHQFTEEEICGLETWIKEIKNFRDEVGRPILKIREDLMYPGIEKCGVIGYIFEVLKVLFNSKEDNFEYNAVYKFGNKTLDILKYLTKGIRGKEDTGEYILENITITYIDSDEKEYNVLYGEEGSIAVEENSKSSIPTTNSPSSVQGKKLEDLLEVIYLVCSSNDPENWKEVIKDEFIKFALENPRECDILTYVIPYTETNNDLSPDSENQDLEYMGVTDNGTPFLVRLEGGDWEYPTVVIYYLNSKGTIGRYIAEDGNMYNHITMTPFGSEETLSIKEQLSIVKKNSITVPSEVSEDDLGKFLQEEGRKYYNLGECDEPKYDIEKCIEEFKDKIK